MGEFKGTINLNGRPKGKPNKDTAEIRANFQKLIEGNLQQLEKDLDSLKPYERIKVILELAKFVIPQLKATELTASVNDKRFQPLVINMINEDDAKQNTKNGNKQL